MTIRQPEEHLQVRLLVHTHWDREWYRSVQEFRPRLVALIDEVLDRFDAEPFLLDGQAVVLDDYLTVRPERAADLSNALRQGVLEAGPWYVLADALIPSAEGLVRNLLAGRRVLRSLRAAPPDVLYCPDSFGHPAMLPAIATGVGCGVIVLWRGYGGRTHPPSDTAIWAAPDESRVLLYHLPPDGYEFGSHLPVAQPAVAERWESIRAVLEPRAITGMALLTIGADHHAPQANLDEAIRALAAAAAPAAMTRASLAGFGKDLATCAAGEVLPTVQGELRDSYGYTWTLQGTFGSRAALKRRYAQAERHLLRDVEPWVALARFRTGSTATRALTHEAWKPVLLCQPHDTLCGCSIDAVADAMNARLGEARLAGMALREEAMMALLGHDANAARLAPAEWTPLVAVRNRAARARSGVAELDIDLVLDDAPVGPASAGIEPRARKTGAVSLGETALAIQDVSRERTFAREEASRHYPWNRLVERRRVLAWVPDVPPLGVTLLPILERRRRAPVLPATVVVSGLSLIGSELRVDAGDQHVALSGPGNAHLPDWLQIEAEGERGDLYTRSVIPETRSLATLRRARVSARGPLRAELTCDWRLTVPERRLTSAAGVPRRSPATTLGVRTTIQMDAAAPFVRVIVSGENTAPDLRLRVGFRTGIPDPVVIADAAFGPVQREQVVADSSGRLREAPPSTAPLHRYVSTFAADRGSTLYADGLAEYEVDGEGMVWVTLLRGVGELSRHDLPERPGHAGYPVATPAAQSLGPFEARFAFAMHGPRSHAVTSFIEQLADDVLLPLAGETWRTALREPPDVHGPALSGEGLALSAVKESEDGEWLVLRAVNLLDVPATGEWALAGVREASLARLDEVPVGALPVAAEGRVRFEAGPRAVVTVLVR